MRSMRRLHSCVCATAAFAAAMLALAGCAEDAAPDSGDDSLELAFEGTEVTAQLDADGISPAFEAPEAFIKIGVMFDATTDVSLELRTSMDGTTWGEWFTPEVTFAEEGAHSAVVDLGGTEALWFQYRIAPGSTPPTFLVLETVIEPPVDAAAIGDQVAEESPDGLGVSSATLGGLTIHTRSEWGARAWRCSSAIGSVGKATIHHTVTPTNDSLSAPARLRQIQSFHMNTNGWCDIGYNYIISRDGRVWVGRGRTRLGAHVEGHNTGNIGISFLGTYTTTSITTTQRDSAARLLKYLHGLYPALNRNRTDVKGHRQYGSTSCPGTRLYNQIDSIVSRSLTI